MKDQPKENILKLKNISVNYGGVQALNDVSLEINEGEIIALLGPNGSGKTTILKSIFGLVEISGEIFLNNKKIIPKSYNIVKNGISYVPQGKQIFKDLTVYENLELGGYSLENQGSIKENIENVLKFFPDLKLKLHDKAKFLSGGQQQMLTIARGLVSNPKVLLLDEPSLGLSPKIVKKVFEKIIELNKLKNISIVIVEHSIKTVLEASHKAYVLSKGKIVYDGRSEDLLDGDKLKNIFLSA